jgi:tetratricopeptide (TPR) repeat protein
MIKALAGFVAAMAATSAWAQTSVAIAPPAAWVKPAPIPAAPGGDSTAAARLLLQDIQTRFSADGDETYIETAVRFQTPQGLQSGTVALPWNPETDTLTVHKVHIVRGDQVIDALGAGQTFTVLRRETNLEAATLDGVLTAALQPEGLQVGDVLDIAFTVKRHDPALQGHSQYLTGDIFQLPVTRLRIRQVWPADKAMRWKETDGLAAPVVTKTADGAELVVDVANAERVKPPTQAPARFSNVDLIETTDFADWGALAAVMAPLFDKAATLKPDSPLNGEIAKIKAASSDPKAQAAAALRLVQDDVRYVFLGSNDGGYVPAAADTTWARRFGDCKGKTALLVALLRGLGLDVQPALVSSHGADGLDAMLPTTLLFDHVLVRLNLGGKTYWLDGTRTGDRSLDAISVPNLDWALPVQAAGSKLERLVPDPPKLPLMETDIHLDASTGLDAAASAHLETVLRGDAGLSTKLAIDQLSSAERDQRLRKLLGDSYSWIDIKSVDAKFDEATGEERLILDGTAKLDWPSTSDWSRQYEAEGSELGWKADFSREPGPHHDAPIAVPFPFYTLTSETIILPRGGAGFSVSGADVSETEAGRSFKRTAKIDHGVFTMQSSFEAVAKEFPANQATIATADLKALSESKLYVKSPRFYQPTDQELEARIKATPTDAAGYTDRADAFATRGDFASALDDMNRAVALKPTDADTLNARCFVRARANKELTTALDDCNEALRLTPRAPPTLDSRGFVYFRLGQFDRAIADYDAALAVDQSLAPSLYVRGLAKRRLGDVKGGDADVAAAEKLFPAIADWYKRMGVSS